MLVAGGVDAGAGHTMYSFQSYSSAWIYDPESSTWQRAGLMRQARTDPSGALLQDGRVLIAGGTYETLVPDAGPLVMPVPTRDVGAGGLLAARRPMILADIGPHPPQPPVPVLASAALYDPVTNSWSLTGSLNHPRYGAPAVTLTDGRVLVVGTSFVQEGGRWGRSGEVTSDPEAAWTGEVYDPRSGRFTLTGRLPAAVLGGSLVALPNGDALMLGWLSGNFSGLPADFPDATPLRFDAAGNGWSVVGDPLAPARTNALVARLADGRILVAGGEDERTGPSADAVLYDPAADRWVTLPPMPEPRAGGTTVLGSDGAVLLLGGYSAGRCFEYHYSDPSPVGLASALWFVPAT